MRDWKKEKLIWSFVQFHGSAIDNNMNPLDIVLRLKLDPQCAIVRSDNRNSGADGLKAYHQLSQLPNYICQEEVEIRGATLLKQQRKKGWTC